MPAEFTLVSIQTGEPVGAWMFSNMLLLSKAILKDITKEHSHYQQPRGPNNASQDVKPRELPGKTLILQHCSNAAFGGQYGFETLCPYCECA